MVDARIEREAVERAILDFRFGRATYASALEALNDYAETCRLVGLEDGSDKNILELLASCPHAVQDDDPWAALTLTMASMEALIVSLCRESHEWWTALAASEKEARRYRWLRDGSRLNDDGIDGQIVVAAAGGEDILTDKALDQRIDIEMAEAPPTFDPTQACAWEPGGKPQDGCPRCKNHHPCDSTAGVQGDATVSGVATVTRHGVTMPAAVWERIKDGVPPDYTEDEFRAYSAIGLAREQAARDVQEVGRG